MIIVNCEQGSEEWFKARLGVATSSEFSKIITPAKGDYSTQANGYMNKLIAEKITGKEATGFMSDWMERGKEIEQEARETYEFINGVTVQKVGFVYRDERKLIGCSPDAFVCMKETKADLKEYANCHGLEIKCPSPGVMVSYILRNLLNNDIPLEYIPQVQGSLLVTGFKQWDLMIYHPDFKPVILTIDRDDEYISKMEKHLHKFTTDLTSKLKKVQAAQ